MTLKWEARGEKDSKRSKVACAQSISPACEWDSLVSESVCVLECMTVCVRIFVCLRAPDPVAQGFPLKHNKNCLQRVPNWFNPRILRLVEDTAGHLMSFIMANILLFWMATTYREDVSVWLWKDVTWVHIFHPCLFHHEFCTTYSFCCKQGRLGATN